MVRKNGNVPVMCRITIDGSISQFSCKVDVDPAMWQMKTNRVGGRRDRKSTRLNSSHIQKPPMPSFA